MEKNRFIADYGQSAADPVQNQLVIGGSSVTVRNNIFDGTGSSVYWSPINITEYGSPAPDGVYIYNNTIYNTDVKESKHASYGLFIVDTAFNIKVVNNLFQLQDSSIREIMYCYSPGCSNVDSSGNLLTSTPLFVDAENDDPLLRNFWLDYGSQAIDFGIELSNVMEDFSGISRPRGGYRDAGAFEYEQQ